MKLIGGKNISLPTYTEKEVDKRHREKMLTHYATYSMEQMIFPLILGICFINGLPWGTALHSMGKCTMGSFY